MLSLLNNKLDSSQNIIAFFWQVAIILILADCILIIYILEKDIIKNGRKFGKISCTTRFANILTIFNFNLSILFDALFVRDIFCKLPK